MSKDGKDEEMLVLKIPFRKIKELIEYDVENNLSQAIADEILDRIVEKIANELVKKIKIEVTFEKEEQ